MVAAFSLGGVFITLTFHWWIVTIFCAVLTLAAIVAWLWTATAEIPRAEFRDIGLGKKLPLYTSGPRSVGWWGMFITMAGDGTAYASLMFGYFFYWTIHEDFTAGHAGPGVAWPLLAAGLFTLAWLAMLLARRVNASDRPGMTRAALLLSAALTLAGCLAGIAGPHRSGMDPTAHVYPAIVWVVAIWTVAHGAIGIVMQAYCLARSLAGRMSARHDMDMHNVVLYWHFLVITAVTSFGVVGLFPAVR
jgi:cytochrome c oxidase subunit I+III